MAYGIIKVDTVTFTDAGIDKSVSISGLVQNPTFSGNVTVTGTLSGVTVTGTTASFTSGVFTNISGGTHTITSGVFAAGSAASPSISFTSDPDTGLYSPGANQVALSTNGTGRLFVDASGNVGVGVASPAAVFGGGGGGSVDANGPVIARGALNAEQNTCGVLQYNSNVTTLRAYGATALSGELAFAVGGGGNPAGTGTTEAMRIDGSGLVGIGTSSPGHNLEIQATAGASQNAVIRLRATDSGSGAGSVADISAIGTGAQVSALAFSTRDGSNIVERLRIDGAGNVGIGTASPGAPVHVSKGSAGETLRLAGDSVNARYLSFTSSDAGIFTGAQWDRNINSSGGIHAWSINGTERARIDSSGRLLVGTSSTEGFGAKLQIRDDGGLNCEMFRSVASASGPTLALSKSRGSAGSPTVVSSGDVLSYIAGKGYDGAAYQEAATIKVEVDGTPGANDMPGRLVFSTTADGASSPTERMRLNSAGSQQSFSANDVYRAASEQGAGTSFGFYYGYHSATSTQTGTLAYLVQTNGDVKNTNNSYGAISDIKLKENIVDASSQWNDIRALQVRNYNFKEGQTHTQIGLIAQEVELVSPGLVTESTDRDEDGNDLGTVTKSVNYSVLYMKAVKALQEAMERIETLEAKVAALETQ